jgi:hypothetical protein
MATLHLENGLELSVVIVQTLMDAEMFGFEKENIMLDVPPSDINSAQVKQ